MLELSVVQQSLAEALCVSVQPDGSGGVVCVRHRLPVVADGAQWCATAAQEAADARPVPVRVEGVTSEMVEAAAAAAFTGTTASEYCSWDALPIAARERKIEEATRALNAAWGLR